MSLTETLKVVLTGGRETDFSPTNFETSFTCEDCGSRFETVIRANRPTSCPDCGSTDVDRI